MLVTSQFANSDVARQRLTQTEKVTKVRLVKLNYTMLYDIIWEAQVLTSFNGCGIPNGLYKVNHVQQYFTNKGVNATITLNKAIGRISIRSDQNMF